MCSEAELLEGGWITEVLWFLLPEFPAGRWNPEQLARESVCEAEGAVDTAGS